MKPSGYLLITQGSVSGTAHRGSLDFWKPKFDKGDKVECMYSASEIKKVLEVMNTSYGIDDVIALLEQDQNELVNSLRGQKGVKK